MTSVPSGGCDDPRNLHHHWCGFCGASLAFSRIQCRQLRFVPPCPRCGEKDWRGDVDELAAPDHRENQP